MPLTFIQREVETYRELAQETWKKRHDFVMALYKLQDDYQYLVRLGCFHFDEIVKLAEQVRSIDEVESLYQLLSGWDSVSQQIREAAAELRDAGFPLQNELELVKRIDRTDAILSGKEHFPAHLSPGGDFTPDILAAMANDPLRPPVPDAPDRG